MKRHVSINARLSISFIAKPFIHLLLLSVIAWFLPACNQQKKEATGPGEGSASPPPAASRTAVLTRGTVDLRTAIVQVAKENIPAVVHIEVTQREVVSSPFMPFENDPFFRFFFNVPRTPDKFKRELKGLGTGMIIDTQGHILTNNHVVGGAAEIQVLLDSGERYSARLVGADPKTDLAVIKITTDKSLPHVSFGDSDKVEVGEWVVAIGHPRGLDQTVTQGIISAKHRTGVMDPSSYQDFLQTDAAINPGNSGGPLLNLQGEVIGVNAAIVSESGGYEGIGFAIPCNMTRHIADQLIATGKVTRGWLGVSIQDLTPEIARQFGVESTKGALIADVLKGGPAEKAGVKRGDVIIGYNNKQITGAVDLQNTVALSAIGQQVQVTLLRGGSKESIPMTIGDLEDSTKKLSASVKERFGIEVGPVTSKEVEKYELESQQGVVISRVERDGAFGKAGFEVGDIILEVNSQPIENVDAFVDMLLALKPLQKIAVLALDHRSGNTGYVEVKI